MKWLNLIIALFVLVALALAIRWYRSLQRVHLFQSEAADTSYHAVMYDNAAAIRQKQAKAIRDKAEKKINDLKEQGHVSLAMWADRINRL